MFGRRISAFMADNNIDASPCVPTKQNTTLAMIGLRYGREDELESDAYGFRILVEAGYDPRGLAELMDVLDAASSGGRPPEFLSTHPNPGNRRARIAEAIAERIPTPPGLPSGLRRGDEDFAAHVLRAAPETRL